MSERAPDRSDRSAPEKDDAAMTTRLDDLMGPAGDPDDTLERPVAPDVAPEEAELFDDDAFAPPARTSRFTIALVALLLLMVGVVIGVQLERVAGAGIPGAPAAARSSSAGTPSR
jgi:hypothetical protein